MASPGPSANGDDPETIIDFFRVGEIRLPTDEDFQYFVTLSDDHDGWIQKFDKDGTIVWMKEVPGNTVKMLKVSSIYNKSRENLL